MKKFLFIIGVAGLVLAVSFCDWVTKGGRSPALASVTGTEAPVVKRTLTGIAPAAQCRNGFIMVATYLLDDGSQLGEAFDVNTKLIVMHYYIEPGAQTINKIVVYDRGEQVVFTDREEVLKKYPDLCVLLNGSTDILTKE